MDITPLAPTRSCKPRSNSNNNPTWTAEEDELLIRIASSYQNIPWSNIAKYFTQKTAPQLAGRWEKVLDPTLVKGSWTREEDETIINYVERFGDRNWAKLAGVLKGRTGKQCRERFKNHLDSNVQRTPWSEEEDALLINLHEQMGNSWTKMSTYFSGRTDNCIKNRWNSTIKKRLMRMELGEPLVKKRGRKPKSYSDSFPKPSFPEEDVPVPSISSVCSSPVMAPTNRTPSLVEIAPLMETIPRVFMKNEPIKETISLEQNRSDLLRLLSCIV